MHARWERSQKDTEMTLKVRIIALAAAILSLACGAGASPPGPDARALAYGAAVKKLDGGRLESLPTGAMYFRAIHFVQPAAYTINSTQHNPGFVFVESGLHQLQFKGQPPLELASGEAKFIRASPTPTSIPERSLAAGISSHSGQAPPAASRSWIA